MVDSKISALTASTTPLATDELPINSSGTTKKITRANIAKDIINSTAKTANYTVLSTDEGLLGNSTGGSFTFALPALSGTDGKKYKFKKVSSDSNLIYIDPDTTETIDGLSDFRLINQNEYVEITSYGTEWKVTGHYSA
jgi:hypothetical protein